MTGAQEAGEKNALRIVVLVWDRYGMEEKWNREKRQ